MEQALKLVFQGLKAFFGALALQRPTFVMATSTVDQLNPQSRAGVRVGRARGPAYETRAPGSVAEKD